MAPSLSRGENFLCVLRLRSSRFDVGADHTPEITFGRSSGREGR